ncbi:helix-turn-helix transcriptional regulator [Flavobacterium sp. GNP001]
MIKKYALVFMIFLTGICAVLGQPPHIIKLEKQINGYNDAQQYEKSINVLSKITTNSSASSYDKYFAYLYMSYTYKRLFNYTKALNKLEQALLEGMKSDHPQEVSNKISAEKCFVYFDNHEYDKAAKLLVILRADGYKHLDTGAKSWLIMQDGYLKMLDKKYDEALQLLDEAAAIIKAEAPEHLPNIYGKKIEVYNKMKLDAQRDNAFKEGLAIAKKYKKIKYEMYLYEVMRNTYQENNDYKNAFDVQKKYDSIVKLYDATDANGKLELAELQLEQENTKLKEQNARYLDYILYGVIVALLLLLYFAVRLYYSNKTRRILVEQENTRIYGEIEKLTHQQKTDDAATVILPEYDFTDRQREIITWIKNGLTNKEIANKLHISENTVKYHLKIIYEVMKVPHRSAIK